MSVDAIVIGAGHNGLVAAARLGQAGRKVLVLEAQDRPGGLLGASGGMRIAPMPTGLHPDIARTLALHRHGLSYDKPMTTIVLGSGAPVRIDGGNAAGVDAAMAADYARLHRRLVKQAGALGQMLLKVPPRLSDGGVADLISLGRMGLSVRMLGKADMRDLLRILLSNAWDLLNDEIGDGPLAAALAMDATLGGAMGPRSPGTVLALLYRMAGQGAGAAGQRAIPLGGPEALVQALVKAVEESGGQIRAGAPVERILVGDDDRVAGVRLAGGEEFRAPLVLSNAHPRRTLVDLLGVAEIDSEDARRARLMATEGMVARLDLALSSMPEVEGLGAGDLGQRLVIAPDMRAIETAFNAAKYRALPARPILECTIVPGDNPSLSVSAQFVPRTLKSGWIDADRAQLAASVLGVLDDALPGIAKRVTDTAIATPADIEARFGLPGGHWHHGEFRVDQMLMLRPFGGAAQYRMPVAGLYLCGAGAHPGGDISGAPGWNAAGRALKDGRAAT
ncbi:phytoene desaturase family protein [Defluviimonas sp. SAOS-178_SWC]|uniref:phytoene desaturase family protein n=1 Tax=Defluviimonas sp. SAOS-178_SWC TaxID=3121287 RepID=UPI0032213FA2